MNWIRTVGNKRIKHTFWWGLLVVFTLVFAVSGGWQTGNAYAATFVAGLYIIIGLPIKLITGAIRKHKEENNDNAK